MGALVFGTFLCVADDTLLPIPESVVALVVFHADPATAGMAGVLRVNQATEITHS